MNRVIAKTTVNLKTEPEVGNLASIFNLHHSSAAYGIIDKVLPTQDDWLVEVTWYAPSGKRRKAYRENLNNRAADRIVAGYKLEAALRD